MRGETCFFCTHAISSMEQTIKPLPSIENPHVTTLPTVRSCSSEDEKCKLPPGAILGREVLTRSELAADSTVILVAELETVAGI